MNKLQVWYWNARFWLRPSIQYAVITKINDEYGNLYDDLIVLRHFEEESPEDTSYYFVRNDQNAKEWKRIKVPVFEVGEILIINRYEREVGGINRKPSKWDVEYEVFWTARKAIKRYNQLVAEEAKKRSDQ